MKRQMLGLSAMAGLLAFCFGSYAQYVQPTDVPGAGLSYIAPDVLVWYSLNGYVTNGPVQIGVNESGIPYQVWNNKTWGPMTGNGSVLGDQAFLITTMTFADDGFQYSTLADPHAHMRYTTTIAPADGSPPTLVNSFYDDYGYAWTNAISSRQDGNPGVVGGDRRYGATNIMFGGETSAQLLANAFNTDGRWNYPVYPLQGAIDGTSDAGTAYRYSTVQALGVNPADWSVNPLCNAFDVAYSADPTHQQQSPLPLSGGQQVGRFGGEITCLSDGNFVVNWNDETKFYYAGVPGIKNGTVSLAAILRPDGTYVKNVWPVAPHECWVGVVAFKNGFCIRVGGFTPTDWSATNYYWTAGWTNNLIVPPNYNYDALLFFYDNAGNCYATNSMVGSTKAAIPPNGLGWYQAGARGDATGLAADVRSHYIYYADKFNSGVGAPTDGMYVAIWDGWTGHFVTNALWTTTDPSVHAYDAFGIGVDALDRFCVASDMKPDAVGVYGNPFPAYQIAARVGQFDGTNITWLTPMFYPFVNHEWDQSNPFLGIQTDASVSVQMTTKAICIADRGWINSTNNPAGGPDTANPTCIIGGGPCVEGNTANSRTMLYTVISHPAPVEPPHPQLTMTQSGGNMVLSWPYDLLTYGFWTLQSSSSMSPDSWAPMANAVVAGSTAYSTNGIGTGSQFFRLARW